MKMDRWQEKNQSLPDPDNLQVSKFLREIDLFEFGPCPKKI
jgi:hypothetical protein